VNTNTLILTLIASHIHTDQRGVRSVSYIHANQPIPQRDGYPLRLSSGRSLGAPWEYSDIEQDLLFLAQPLPGTLWVRWGPEHVLIVQQPEIRIRGTWARVTQRLFYL